jgi:hypothetical protein
MPSKTADRLRHERDTIAANATAQQFSKTSAVGFFHRNYGSTADVTTDGTNRIRVAFLAGSLRVGDAVNVQIKGYRFTKGYEGL